MASVRLEIKGQPESISLRSFLAAVNSLSRVLSDLDAAVSGEPRGSLDWVVSRLGMGSLEVDVTSRPRGEEKNVGSEVAHVFVSGLQLIEQRGLTPPFFSEASLDQTRRLLKQIGRDGTAGFVVTDFVDTVEISGQATANVDLLLTVRRRSLGSVEGRLEMISLHKRPRFVVYHALTQKAVTCRFEPDRWLTIVKGALGRRVVVSGVVQSNAKGEPLRIELDDIRILRTRAEIPPAARLGGAAPGYTGELTTSAFIKHVRGG